MPKGYKYISLETGIEGDGYEWGVYQIINKKGCVGATNFRFGSPRRAEKRKKKQSYHRYWKERAYNALGNKCVRCGMSDIRALEIDHIKNDGYMDRINGKRSNYKEYQYIALHTKEASKRLQILCANCNRIKMWEENEHKKKTNRRYNKSG